MTDLFHIPESKSPRLKWMEKYNIKTWFTEGLDYPWCAATEEMILRCSDKLGTGDTEDEAITNLAKSLGIRLWNETISGAPACAEGVELSATNHFEKGSVNRQSDSELSGDSASAEHVEPSADCQNNG